jgi:hypothetical protein
MRLVTSKIPDVTESNIDQSKQILAHSIIKNVYPLFDEIQKSKDDNINTLKHNLAKRQKELKNEKITLESLMETYKRKKKVSKLLDRVKSLINAGLVYDSSIKHEMIILLKIVDKLPEDKLEMHLSKTMQLLSKRFSK